METIHLENRPFSVPLARGSADRFPLHGLQAQLACIYLVTLEYYSKNWGGHSKRPEDL